MVAISGCVWTNWALIERQRAQLERELERLLAQPLATAAAILNSFPAWACDRATVLAEQTSAASATANRSQVTAASTPHVRSGRQAADRHISKRGPSNLRWVLVQAAWTAIRLDPQVKRIWLRISRKAGKRRPRWLSPVAYYCGCGGPSARVSRIGFPSRLNKITCLEGGTNGIDSSPSILGHGLQQPQSSAG